MLVSITEARVRSLGVLPAFVKQSGRIVAQARSAPGNHGARVFLRGPLTWCTVTVWADEAAMVAFVRSGAHLAAMKRTRELVSATRFARAEAESLGSVTRADAVAALDALELRQSG